jgi:hypothetical protein
VLERVRTAYRIEAGVSALTLELDLGHARACAALAHWPAVAAVLQPWLDLQAEPSVQLPLAAMGEINALAGSAAQAQGRPARAWLERALGAYERLDVPHSPRRARAQHALDALAR